jgi:hypothetical protein
MGTVASITPGNEKNTWLGDSNDLNPATLARMDVAGASGSRNSAIVSGELNDTGTGIVNWGGTFAARDGSPEKAASPFNPATDASDEKFDLSVKDPRYQHCLDEARKLKAEYPLEGLDPSRPADNATIVEREKAIGTALIAAIHREYGDYNQAVAHNKEPKGTLHDDINRAYAAADPSGNSKAPALSEFARGELICRHYASLTSNLLNEAGVANFEVHGVMKSRGEQGNVAGNTGQPGHAFVVSRLTGNVFESTVDEKQSQFAYQKRINDLSISDFLKGGVILTGDDRQISAYGTGNGNEQSLADNALQNRQTAEKNFLSAIAKGDVAAAQSLVDTGVRVGKEDLAGKLQDVLKSHNAELAGFLIKNGALEGYETPPVTEKEKIQFLFNSIGNDKVSPNFLKAMQSAFNIPQEDAKVFMEGARTEDQRQAIAYAFHMVMPVELPASPYQQPDAPAAGKPVPVHVNFGMNQQEPPVAAPQAHDVSSLGQKLMDSGVSGATSVDNHSPPSASGGPTAQQKAAVGKSGAKT